MQEYVALSALALEIATETNCAFREFVNQLAEAIPVVQTSSTVSIVFVLKILLAAQTMIAILTRIASQTLREDLNVRTLVVDEFCAVGMQSVLQGSTKLYAPVNLDFSAMPGEDVGKFSVNRTLTVPQIRPVIITCVR